MSQTDISENAAGNVHSRSVFTKQEKIACILSEKEISIQNDTLCFREGDCLPKQTTQEGLFGRIQEFVKQYGWFYYKIVRWLSPVQWTLEYQARRKQFFSMFGTDAVIVNYGSGPQRIRGREDIINADLFAFNEVDVVIQTRLPFNDNSVDCFLNLAVLEHMNDAPVAVSEMYRCLKPGGQLLAYVPFMIPFHAAPHDYYRWTRPGVAELFKAYSDVEVGVGSGPTSGLLWMAQEWLSMVLSFGISPVKDMVFMALMLLTFPLKWLDLLISKHPAADRLAGGFFIHARK